MPLGQPGGGGTASGTQKRMGDAGSTHSDGGSGDWEQEGLGGTSWL